MGPISPKPFIYQAFYEFLLSLSNLAPKLYSLLWWRDGGENILVIEDEAFKRMSVYLRISNEGPAFTGKRSYCVSRRARKCKSNYKEIKGKGNLKLTWI